MTVLREGWESESFPQVLTLLPGRSHNQQIKRSVWLSHLRAPAQVQWWSVSPHKALLAANGGVCPTPTHCLTPAASPAIQFNSDMICLGLTRSPQAKGSAQSQTMSPLQTPVASPGCNLCFSPHWMSSRGGCLLRCDKLLNWLTVLREKVY